MAIDRIRRSLPKLSFNVSYILIWVFISHEKLTHRIWKLAWWILGKEKLVIIPSKPMSFSGQLNFYFDIKRRSTLVQCNVCEVDTLNQLIVKFHEMRFNFHFISTKCYTSDDVYALSRGEIRTTTILSYKDSASYNFTVAANDSNSVSRLRANLKICIKTWILARVKRVKRIVRAPKRSVFDYENEQEIWILFLCIRGQFVCFLTDRFLWGGRYCH